MNDINEQKKILYLPPTVRFIVELSTWIWLILAGFNYTISWNYTVFWGLFVYSLLSLALFNFPGDKRSIEAKGIGVAVPGWFRILTEILSSTMGIIAAFFYVGIAGGIPQIVVTLFAFFLDRKRWWWMLGKAEKAPDYVTIVHRSK